MPHNLNSCFCLFIFLPGIPELECHQDFNKKGIPNQAIMRRQNVPKSDKEKSLKGVHVTEKWVEVETIGLNTQDRNTILSVTGLLDDRIINAAQTLLNAFFYSRTAVHYTGIKSKL